MSDATGDFAKAALEYELEWLKMLMEKERFVYAEIKTALGDAYKVLPLAICPHYKQWKWWKKSSQSVKR